MRAASSCSWFMLCSEVMKISVANGSHCHDTMTMTGEQRAVGEPVHGLRAKEHPHLRQHAVDGVHHHVLPHQRVHRGHDEERRNQQHPHDAAPGNGSLMSSAIARRTTTVIRITLPSKMVLTTAVPERWVGDEVLEVLQPRKPPTGRAA